MLFPILLVRVAPITVPKVTQNDIIQLRGKVILRQVGPQTAVVVRKGSETGGNGTVAEHQTMGTRR